MDYEKKYTAALDAARHIYDAMKSGGNFGGMEDLEVIFPELRESEDERIRKEIIAFIKAVVCKTAVSEERECKWISYLEKQKEQKPQDQCVDVIKMSALLAADRLASAEMTGRLKERKEILENPEKYGLCKPAEWNANDKTFIKDCARILDENGYAASAERLLSILPIKPAEKQDYSGLTNLERAIHRGFLCAGVENVPVGIIKETAQECLAQMKPAEWSDEDKRMVTGICANLTKYCTQYCNKQSEPSVTQYDFAGKKRKEIKEQCDWLESLRPQPKQEWSEEDESMRWNVISIVGQSKSVQAEEMMDWLKSLRPSWKPNK